ncbi:MAG: hypothetical protein LBK82_13975 [Planctomycetaceae bacterium]|jgi:hypothetical protein|nr:hypothetical protein [Planctomycetaceae bacterium]
MRIFFVIIFLFCSIITAQEQNDFPTAYLESLPDKPLSDVIPETHDYIYIQHDSTCVACAVARAGEKISEFEGKNETRYVVAWTHASGRRVDQMYNSDEVGMYGSDAALAIEKFGFLPASELDKTDYNKWYGKQSDKLGWDEDDEWWKVFAKYRNKTDKYPVAIPNNINDVQLCLRKGLPVLFVSTAKWRPAIMRQTGRREYITTQFGENGAHVVTLRDYFSFDETEYCNLINSHGERHAPLKLIWLDWIQADYNFSCFVILPKNYFERKK